jgi:hypothetical protein
MSIELAVDTLLKGERCAYYAPTYKDSYEWWKQIKGTAGAIISGKDEQVKQLTTITGGLLDVWSMDDPDSGRGRKYHRAIMDECEKAPKFREAWLGTIRATLADFKGDAWFLSTPKFGKTFFKELAAYPEKFTNWVSWLFTTYDNPHIDPEEIEDARRTMDPLYFRCEFLAEDVDLTGKPFLYNFNPERHIVTGLQFDPLSELQISFDFNVDPITAVVGQYVKGQIRLLKEYRLENSNVYELCDRIRADYPTALYLVTGDAAGRQRSALSNGNINYYTVIRQKLNLSEGQLKVMGVNPAVSDTRVLFNSILQNFDYVVDKSCTFAIEDFKYVEVDDNGDIDKKKDKHRSHLLDAERYRINTFYKHLIKGI